ncbi:protein LSM12 homolog A-like [Tubulanus polymorphus]|uniref:protein LSM12 homolog A-like n=1 Tax=Tubulanus polymorphus TaxID=672921 RepID=UPI003DA683D8
MKLVMAEEDYFQIGSFISCTTCHEQELKGEVVAFDYPTKMVVLKQPPTNERNGLNDVRFINVSLVKHISLIKPAQGSPEVLSHLNLSKLTNRLKQNLDDKRRQLEYIGVDVPPEGQRVFNAITKTIKEVRWQEKNIIVLDQVTITPPYTIDCCKCREDSPNRSQTLVQKQKALDHVKKIVEKYFRETSSSEKEDGQ